jgi:hypothetical protein
MDRNSSFRPAAREPVIRCRSRRIAVVLGDENPDIHLVVEDDWGERSAVPDVELRLLRTSLTRYSEDIKLDLDLVAQNLQADQIKAGQSLNQDDLEKLWRDEKC